MSDRKPGSEAAFPQSGFEMWGPEGGLTKREFFAAMALQGIMANPMRWADIQRRYDKGQLTYNDASIKNAEKAASLADALIEVLARSVNTDGLER